MDSALFYDNDNKEIKGKTLLATIDESADYEVDISEIWRDNDTGTFFFYTASGCSCWSGEYETRIFDSLENLEKDIRGKESDNYMYNPSFKGLEELLATARNNV